MFNQKTIFKKFKEEIINLLIEHKVIVITGFIFFFSGIGAGFIFFPQLTSLTFDLIMSLFFVANNQSGQFLASNILAHNLQAMFLVFISGVSLIGPFLILFFNGLTIGLILAFINRLAKILNFSFISAVFSLIPHGIFEIIALILTIAFSLKIFLKIYFRRKIFSRQSFSLILKKSVYGLLIIVMPLFFIAAVVETYISPYFLSYQKNLPHGSFQLEKKIGYLNDDLGKNISFAEFYKNLNNPDSQNNDPNSLILWQDKTLYLFNWFLWIFLPDEKIAEFQEIKPTAVLNYFYQTDNGDLIGLSLGEHQSAVLADKYMEFVNQQLEDKNTDISTLAGYKLYFKTLVKNEYSAYLVIKTKDQQFIDDLTTLIKNYL